MKQKDILLIVTVVFVSAIFSLLISNLFLSSSNGRHEQVEVVEPISTDFPNPDERYFNNKSIDPTQRIEIGDSSNPKPFNSGN